ncbi:MAG: efflux RND transporter periplasmic adaptor subunit [Cytophagales bacterium]|nr:efflux RND transporter periplasmic adaptor subunit [Cytophagales bacterium]
MKKVVIWVVLVLFLGLSGWLGYYFYKKSKQDPIIYKTENPVITTIIKKTVATGSIVPRREVLIKPQVSGIVEALYVEAGQLVKKGQLLARIKIVPNMVNLNQAQTSLETAKINFEQSTKELERNQKLFSEKVISEQEFLRFKLDYNVRKEALDAAQNNLELIQSGASKKSGQVSNLIYSTIEGLILDIPVKVGSSVIERNNFNEGTTIASIADMTTLIFEGKIDESEVGKIREGMELTLTIGAIEDKKFKAELEYIAPKGVTEEGAIKFQIKAKVLLEKGDFLRAGYSANADIILGTKKDVLAVKESTLQFGKDSVFVEVEKQPQVFEKRLIKTGLSDGINIEVLEGLSQADKVKLPYEKEDEKKKQGRPKRF